jgi:hypothetical protein
MVPAGARQVLLCRYSGLGAYPNPFGARSFRLIAHHLVAARATVTQLTGGLNALEKQTGAHSYACPMDDGAAIIAFFRYGSRSDDPVTVGLSGCSAVTNGHLNRLAGVTASGRDVVGQLEVLTR